MTPRQGGAGYEEKVFNAKTGQGGAESSHNTKLSTELEPGVQCCKPRG